jgi:FAD-dependent urate hydroxylase
MPARTQLTDCDIAIVGAGPYGLSAAAHLEAAGFHVRLFGEPMAFWANTMPEGMLLRSPRAASTIADPRVDLTLEAYEAALSIQPAAPVPLSTFVGYGRWFQANLRSELDTRHVRQVTQEGPVFRLTLVDGTDVMSRRVVIAAGVGSFKSTPATFANLPPQRVSHCYEGRPVAEFGGKRVAVVGAGQSALESAALLCEAGAKVEVIARIPVLRWIGGHTWLHHMGPLSSLLYSKHDVGPIGISRLVAYPKIVAHLPLGVRDKIRTRAVRSAGSSWLPPRLVPVKLTTGRKVESAEAVGGDVRLVLDDGTDRRVDHVLLGTGYRVDLSRYDFLAPDVLTHVRQLDGAPVLRSGFASSVPGLHFLGAAAARSFGPLLYFVAGTEFASRELVSYLRRRL